MDSIPADKIYLDYNATTPLAREVIECISTALTSAWANPSSSNEIGQSAKNLINDSRQKIANMLNGESSELVFVSGGTEANNLVLHTGLQHYQKWSKQSKLALDMTVPHIITTNVEHDAILLPLQSYEGRKQAEVSYVAVSPNGKILPEDIENAIKPNTCLVTVMLANNETGVLMPVSDISKVIRRLNIDREKQGLCQILIHTDAAQAFGKIEVDAKELGVDFLTIVGHKFYGPRIGALYVRGLGESNVPLVPMFFGGGQERGYRPGTENTPMICGLGCAADLVCQNLNAYKKNMTETRNLLEKRLKEEFGDDVVFNCATTDRLPNTCSVSFKQTQLSGGEILRRCPLLFASTGAACHGTGKLSAVLLASGVTAENARSAVRLSVGRDTTPTQIEQVVHMLTSAVKG